MTARPLVVIMVKEPRPGRVKTRLGRGIGMVRAAWWFRHQMHRQVRRLAHDRRWNVVLAVAPDGAVRSAAVPAGVARLPQGGGDLGHRMIRLLRRSRRGPVMVIGADIPGVDTAAIAGALERLRGNDVVIGPAVDGGYWLIGVRQGLKLPIQALEGVRWSGPHARKDTERALAPLRIGHAQMLADVDTAEDLVR